MDCNTSLNACLVFCSECSINLTDKDSLVRKEQRTLRQQLSTFARHLGQHSCVGKARQWHRSSGRATAHRLTSKKRVVSAYVGGLLLVPRQAGLWTVTGSYRKWQKQ